ncbi:hypothetical protein, partial [Streptococcus anginosus]|uniref:hypothetical protein n=1 Tax=Streptococcus anginosus TaxID=1328 RepID=UPI003F67290A
MGYHARTPIVSGSATTFQSCLVLLDDTAIHYAAGHEDLLTTFQTRWADRRVYHQKNEQYTHNRYRSML